LSRDEKLWLLNGSGRVSEAELMTTATGSIAAAKRVVQDRVRVDVIFEETSKEALSGAPTGTEAERTKPSLEEPLHSIVMKSRNRPRKPSSELTLENEEAKFHEIMAKARKIAEEKADQDRILRQAMLPKPVAQKLPSRRLAAHRKAPCKHRMRINSKSLTLNIDDEGFLGEEIFDHIAIRHRHQREGLVRSRADESARALC